MSEPKQIVIVLYQYSVVVKGMERKLGELGYGVNVVTEHFDLIEKYGPATDLFMLYLPGDIMDDKLKQKNLTTIIESVKDTKQNMIVVGEKKYHDDLVQYFPDLEAYAWLDRPIDNDKLGEIIETVLSGKMTLGNKKNILVVDDDPSYAGMVREWIKDHYHVHVVTSGMQAIGLLTKKPIDLILLDYEMPVVDGPKVLQMLRQVPETADIPVIFLTGNGTKEAVARVMELKPEGYILKSTTRNELLGYLKKRLD